MTLFVKGRLLEFISQRLIDEYIKKAPRKLGVGVYID
jgi:hypothetical protein